MTPLLLALFLFLPAVAAFGAVMSHPSDRPVVIGQALLAWCALAAITWLFNDWVPFGSGGDDFLYFLLSQTKTLSASEMYSLQTFSGLVEQPGYAWLLTLLNPLAGDNLYSYKLFNLTLFVGIAIIWYGIGRHVHSNRFGTILMVSILILTPMWFYFIFLLKDLVITFFQSLFLYSLVQAYRVNTAKPWVIMLGSTVALFPFRTALLAQNALVAVATLGIRAFGLKKERRDIAPLLFGSAVFLMLVIVASNPEILSQFGLSTNYQLLGSDRLAETAEGYRQTSNISPILFPVIYLFGEISALNPASWTNIGVFEVRGFLALPWILVLLPCFAMGIRWLFTSDPSMSAAPGLVGHLRTLRVVSTPWAALLLFLLSSFAISWTVGDTTRWRLSDMPVFAAIATMGWLSTPPRTRLLLIAGWCLLVVGLSALAYLRS